MRSFWGRAEDIKELSREAISVRLEAALVDSGLLVGNELRRASFLLDSFFEGTGGDPDVVCGTSFERTWEVEVVSESFFFHDRFKGSLLPLLISRNSFWSSADFFPARPALG
jgi:hypothetical protein